MIFYRLHFAYEGCPILKVQAFVLYIYDPSITSRCHLHILIGMSDREVAALVSLFSIDVSKRYKQTNWLA
jgi:hypothetical protein